MATDQDYIAAAKVLADAYAALAVVQQTRASLTEQLNAVNAQIASADGNVKQAQQNVNQAKVSFYKLMKGG